MYEKGLTKDLPEISLSKEVCESCQMGKVHRKSFPKSATWRATEKLELVHTDVCGPMQASSLGHNKYFVLFIDDLSRMTWVYFLSNKSQVFSVFKKFRAFTERQSGCKLKALRSDNGGEYTSNEFNKYCEDMGIDHKLTVSYSPEQNGVSERKNRTVVEMARCLLLEKKLPQSFLGRSYSYFSVFVK
uniref:Putative ovule protein n=1 Tax=Solanum chacoense TaxID=4108 RepID=A0A0V0HMV8_SOLCH